MPHTELTGTPFDPWRDFSTLTSARIALGRAGGSVPTRELLDFGLAHARARDAVWTPFDREGLAAELELAGLKSIALDSAATSRDEYLKRPDLGRRLSDESREKFASPANRHQSPDLCLIVSDGLSSLATRHALAVIGPLHSQLESDGWSIAPIVVVRFGRVAIQDEIGEKLGAMLSLILLGERPGLGSPNSLGAYFVHDPQIGRSDADRNCVSNIRHDGLAPSIAANTLHYLLTQSRFRKLSGVDLKDERTLPSSDARRIDLTAC